MPHSKNIVGETLAFETPDQGDDNQQMDFDNKAFLAYVKEKHGYSKKITASLVDSYSKDFVESYSSPIPYTPEKKGNENRKALVRWLINSNYYASFSN